jgi:uncharacterized iron-regulated membrane protein
MRQADGAAFTVLVNDRTSETVLAAQPLSGDKAAQWIRWIHEGSRGGNVWRWIVFLTGVLPVLFALTGVMMWLRGRRVRRALRARTAHSALQAAE